MHRTERFTLFWKNLLHAPSGRKIAILFLILFSQHEDGATGFSKIMVNSYQTTRNHTQK
jgi:hypothetical protein